MPKGVFLALSNPVSEDVEGDFNRWYDEVHAREVLALPGVRSFRRFRLAADQVVPGPDAERFRYLAIYEVDVDSWDTFAKVQQEAFGDGRITIRPDLIELDPMVLTLSFEEISSSD